MSDQLSNIRAAYRVLENRVVSALRTQLGDQLRLAAVTAQALALASAAEQVSLRDILFESFDIFGSMLN
jgi:hypothetical protein